MTSKNLKILVVGARGIPNVEGGAEKNAEKIFPIIAEMGAEVHLLCLSGSNDMPMYKGVHLPKAPHLRMLGTDKIAYYLYAPLYALKFRPDVVHFQGLGSAILLWLYKLFGRYTVVRYGSADYTLEKWGWLGRLGFRFAELQLKLADRVISVAPALVERLKNNGIQDNVVLIPNALDAPENTGETPNLDRFDLVGKRFVLSVGRVTSQKNFSLLIKSFHAAKAAGAKLDKLVIVGGLDDKKYVSSLQPLLADDVVLTGKLPRNSFQDLLANCHAFVNSSVHEGHSNAIMESISYQNALIVSDIDENLNLKLAEHQYFKSEDLESLKGRLLEVSEDHEKFVTDTSRYWQWSKVAEETFKAYGPRLSDLTTVAENDI